MIKGYKIKIYPTKEQQEIIHKSFGCSRFIYNWCIDTIQKYYDENKKALSNIDLQKLITKLKQNKEYSWLNDVSANMLKQTSIDCSEAFKKWFKHIKTKGITYSEKTKKKSITKGFRFTIKHSEYYPKYKTRKSELKCPTRTDRMVFKGRYVKLEKLGDVKLSKVKLNLQGKLMNARLSFDGIDYWLSFSVDLGEVTIPKKHKTEPIGIDLGLKTLFVCSNVQSFKKPHTKKIDKKIKKFQRKVSHIYQKMIDYCMETRTKFSDLVKSKNLLKYERQLRKYQIKKTNILNSNIHKITSELMKLNPERITIEDLNVKGMMKNHKLANSVMNAKFYEIRRQLIYKCKNNDIKLVIADRWFPSSKTCSYCGSIKKDLKLKDRTYYCKECGTIIDRDLNASINLSRIA